MSLIKQLLRLHQQGCKIKSIARGLGISKNTVKRYLTKVKQNDWCIGDLLKLENPVLETKFHAGNPSYKDLRYEQLKGRLDNLVKELDKVGVTKKLLWDEYIEEFPKGYGRSQFCFHLLQHIRASKPSMVLQHKPADKLFMDFAGKKMHYTDRFTGEDIKCEMFVTSLPYSDYGYMLAIPSQKSEDFIYALRSCLHHLGGVPQLLVPDNFKGAITRANKYEPDINQILQDFAEHYDTTVLPARVRKPKDKALVENQVKLLYTRVYAKLRNQKFFSLEELNIAIQEKVRDHNQTRMQEKPYCRQEKFLAEEKPLLGELPAKPFEVKCYKQYTVRTNNHIKLTEDNHYYSVPFQYIGKKAKVIYTKNLVRIYCEGEQVAVHPRQAGQGTYTSQSDHLCSQHQHYLKRSPDYYLEKARSRSQQMHLLFERIFNQNRHPEQLYGTCDGILNLYRKVDRKKVNRACQIALDHCNYSYKFILNILQNNMLEPELEAEERARPTHENVRGQQYFEQLQINLNKS